MSWADVVALPRETRSATRPAKSVTRTRSVTTQDKSVTTEDTGDREAGIRVHTGLDLRVLRVLSGGEPCREFRSLNTAR